MPMNRYEIRDEYSLADPELYRAADKDDPEALLEGVAMAGLVGVLRQLGDLAEFAAEIFHDLHEEVMATAARGNSLMIRVQQLEAEVPFIEKAFLSQSDHSSFYYNAGVDWHANLGVNQNLVTQGDLPRFVMDSYEECRGPPRLFLLDKFDVAGAGACLKRYTDPSFFKVESSATINANVHSEKKIRKEKKKGPRRRYGETPETLQASSQARMHQLLVEQPVENGVSKPGYRAKLKRRPNGFRFDSKSGNSYMEEFLKNPSPEHKLLGEISVSSSLQMSVDDRIESVLEQRSVNPARECERRKSNPPFADKEETILNPALSQTNDALVDIKIYGVPSYDNILADGIPSTSDEETGVKDIAIVGENKMEGSLIDYESDEIASEIDNYVDAPSTMESEMDTDSELRVKKDFTSYNKNQPLISVNKNQEHCHSLSLDSQSTGDFSISDEGNNSYKKEMSSFLSSDSPRTSAEVSQYEKSSADISEFVIVNATSFVDTPEHGKVPKPVVSYKAFLGEDAAHDIRPHFEQPTSRLCSSNSIPTLPHYDSREGSLSEAKSDETISNSDDDEKKMDLISDPPCSSSVSHSKSLGLGDNSLRSFSGEHQVDGEIHTVSTSADIIHHTSNSLDAIYAHWLHEDDYDQQKDLNLFQNMVSTVKMDNIVSHNIIDSEDIVGKKNPTSVELGNMVAKLTNNFATDYADRAHNGDNVASKVSAGENQINYLYTEDPSVVYETLVSEDSRDNSSNVNNLSAERLILSGKEHSHVLMEAGPDTYDTDFTPAEPTPINGTSELGDPNSSEVVGSQVIGIIDDVTPNDLVALEISSYVAENQEDSSGTSYTAEEDSINPDGGIAGLQPTEISNSLCLKLLSQVPVSLNEFDPRADRQDTAGMVCSIPADTDITIRENVSLHAGLGKVVEEHVSCIQHPGLNTLENDTTSLSGCNGESEVVEEEKNDLSGSHNGQSHTNFSSYFDSEVRHMADVVQSAQTQPPLELSGLKAEDESFQQSNVEHQVSHVDSLHIGCVTEQSPENIELSPPLVPVLPGLRDYAKDASVYPKDPLGSTFPSDNPFSETNLILHPLPPLPPLQWRIGKPQHAPSTADADKMEVKEVFPQDIFPAVTSTGNVNSVPEQTKQSPIQRPQTSENDQPQLFMPKESEVPTAVEEVGVAEGIQVVKLPVQVVPKLRLKQENAEYCSPSLEADSINQADDPPPKVEKEQQHLFMPTEESGVPSEVVEDGIADGSRTMKLPRTCNPVIGSVAALDKSRLRKVAERVKPQTQNQDERVALLDQIRAKSFNLKPTPTSRPSNQGTSTNLKVAAILEKANAIRQALAGSDEDDDNWSDS